MFCMNCAPSNAIHHCHCPPLPLPHVVLLVQLALLMQLPARLDPREEYEIERNCFHSVSNTHQPARGRRTKLSKFGYHFLPQLRDVDPAR